MTPLSLSKIYQGYRAMKKKKIKDAYPKKVCHMLMHVKKKREEERKDSPLSKKKEKVEMVHTKGIHTPSTKKKYPHTCTS